DRVRFVDPYLIDPAMETDTTSDIVASLAAVLHTHGLPDTPVGLPFGCDASKIARSGVPTVVFGPGSIADAHSRTECISMTEVMTAAAVYRDLIMNPSRVHGAGALR
ncbi:MAG: M20/M25/M40 family metallo-hydrolase, partial [Spirochaetales bacterium]|nr:M20/M25/M40 family metallo-hydrolase [Spirochaetales bacterium]